MKVMLVMHAVIAVFGLYLFAITMQMKRTKRVHSMLLAEEELKKCRDEEKMTRFLFPRLLAFSIVITVTGIVGILTNTVISLRYASYVLLVVFLAAFSFFAKSMSDARERFLR